MSDKFILTNGIDMSKKFKAIYPHIIVGNDITNPYYTIHWYDPDLKQITVGFGSYDLKLVHQWLQDCFEVISPSPDYLIDQLSKKESDLSYTLMGVMHSVDKWLDGDELKQDEVNRAATMREKTLQIVEKLEKEKDNIQGHLTSLKHRYDVAKSEVARLSEVQVQYVRAYFEEFITRLIRDCQMTTLDTSLLGAICKDLMEAMEVDFANLADFTHLIEVRAYQELVEKIKLHSRKMQSSDFSGEFWDKAVLVTDIDNLLKEKVDKKNVD